MCQGAGEVQTEVECGVSYSLLVPTPTRTLRPVTYVWAAAAEGASCHLRVYTAQTSQQVGLKELGTVLLSSCQARAIIFLPGPAGSG